MFLNNKDGKEYSVMRSLYNNFQKQETREKSFKRSTNLMNIFLEKLSLVDASVYLVQTKSIPYHHGCHATVSKTRLADSFCDLLIW